MQTAARKKRRADRCPKYWDKYADVEIEEDDCSMHRAWLEYVDYLSNQHESTVQTGNWIKKQV
jgi:hypothetical protein